ncbi:hypothetical protein G9A89_016564 [Geosiphon pyriformis]|nr:hypothetical protein G9A89_016564 [Geosiphon pyriformis]
MSGPSVKRRSTRISTTGLVGGGSGHKIKKPPGGAKLSSSGATLESGGSGHVVGQFNGMDINGEASKGEKVLDSKMNTPQAKHFNNSATVGSPFGSIIYDMEEEEEVFLPPCKSFSLDRMWVDPKIIKIQVEVAVKKSFTLDINLSAVEGKLAMAKTQVIRKLFSGINESMEKTVLLAKENNIIVNSDLKRQGIHSDWAVVIKEILIDMPKEMIVATVSEFGQVKAVVEFAESSQADQLAAKWSFLIGKDSVCMVKAVRDCETWASRDWYRALLFTLPVETMAHDLGNLLVRAGGKTCVINRSLDTGNRVHCAVVCFENDEVLESAFYTKPIFGGVKLSWVRLDMVRCEQYGKLDYSVLECDAVTLTPLALSKSFKRVVSDENCLQLAKLYAKKSVPISRPAAFGGKSWAQVVSLVSSSNGFHFGSGPGLGSSSGASGVVGHSSPADPVSSFLETHLASLEHSLELLTDKVSGIIDTLDNLNLVPLALASSFQSLIVPGLVDVKFGLDMVLDKSKSAVLPLSSVSSGVSSLGLSSSKILTSKMGCLELKLMALEALVCSVLEKLDQICAGSVWKIVTCNVREMNNSAKQEDIIHWHRDMNNLVSIVIETKLKDKVQPWIANKFDSVQVFVFGLDSGYLGSGVAIIMNNALAKHVCKVFEIPGRLLSVKLLFKNRLSVLILGLYAGASVSACFSQADEINFLIAKAVNKFFFVILGSDFNKNGSRRCVSFKKCFNLGLVNALGGSLFRKNTTWTNSRGVAKTIDYVFVLSSLVNTILDCSVTGVDKYFDTDHRAVTVFVGLGGLLDVNLMSLCKQVNKNHWKFNFKDAMTAKWTAFKEFSTATMAMLKCKFDAALLFLDLDAMWNVICKIVCLSANDVFKKKWFKGYDNVFTKESSKFHKLELLVSKLVKTSRLVSSEKFNSLDTTNASVVESLFLSKSHFEVRKLYHSSKLSESKHAKESHIRSAVSRRMESFEVNKDHTIRSVLERPFHKVVLDHLVADDELVLESSLVKSKVNVIMEGWTRKCVLVTDVSADWCHQYQPLKYVFDDAFSRIMDPINSVKLFGVVSDLPNDKTAGLSSISNKLWKHCDGSKEAWVSMIPKPYEWKEVLTNTQPIALIETTCKILSKILSDRISLACSTHNILRGDNFSVLKGIMTQSPIFAVGSVVEDVLEKNRELWLVLQDMKKAYNSVGWEHLKRSLIRIKMCGRFIQFFGGIHNNRVNRIMTNFGLTDREVFLPLLWRIFYDSLLCEVKRQEEFCGYRLNFHFIAKTGRVESQAGFFSFFAAGAFVDNTIWVGSSQTATQHILNVASEFFRINNISINNDKTVAIPINCRVVSLFLTISGAPISIAKKEEPHWYLGIFLSTGGLLKPSLAKVHLKVQFFTNFVLKKAISNKQFLYLVSAVLHPIVSYRMQFSFVSLSVCCKWDALIRKDFKSKAGLSLDFPNDAFHHPSFYGLKPFEQIQAESKLVSIMCFANAVRILGCLFLHKSHDLQTLSWRPVHPLVFLARLNLNLSNNFLAGVVCIFANCSLSFSSLGPSVFQFSYGISMSLVLGEHWKKLDLHGPIPDWFSVSVGYLGSVESSSSVHDCLIDISFAPNVLESTDFNLVCNWLLGLDANSLSVYTNRFLAGLGTLSVKLGAAVFFDDINMSLDVKVLGLLSFTLAELQAIALAFECVPTVNKAALDVCRSELGLVHPNFRNSCWVEHCHIANLVCAKRLDVSWCKVKRHSGVIGNDRADELAGCAALSDFWFILAGGSSVSGNSRHFVYNIYWSIHCSRWDFGLGTRVVTDKLLSDIDWHRSSSVWHPDSHMAAGFTSKWTAGVSVVCLYCGCVKDSDHVFSCDFDFASRDRLLGNFVVKWEGISGLHCPFSHVLRTLSSCIFDTTVCVALCKDFVFNDWFFKVVSVFGNLKLVGANIVDFVRNFCLAFRDEICSMPVSISGLSSLYLAGVVRLLGIDDALGVRFGLRNFSLFVSGALNAVSVYIGV